jgi:CheY-specific phosphatase CheX
MPVTELDQALSDAATEVLETMFFTAISSDVEAALSPDGSWISAGLTFHGKPSGKFGVSVPVITGRKIAASFLGRDEAETTDAQAGQVVCELTNMLCGSVLSRIEKDTLFDLTSPQLRGEPCPPSFIVSVDEGPVAMWIQFD